MKENLELDSNEYFRKPLSICLNEEFLDNLVDYFDTLTSPNQSHGNEIIVYLVVATNLLNNNLRVIWNTRHDEDFLDSPEPMEKIWNVIRRNLTDDFKLRTENIYKYIANTPFIGKYLHDQLERINFKIHFISASLLSLKYNKTIGLKTLQTYVKHNYFVEN